MLCNELAFRTLATSGGEEKEERRELGLDERKRKSKKEKKGIRSDSRHPFPTARSMRVNNGNTPPEMIAFMPPNRVLLQAVQESALSLARFGFFFCAITACAR